MSNSGKHAAVCVTGASGAIYAKWILESLAGAGYAIDVIVSRRGAEILAHEAGIRIDPDAPRFDGWLSGRAAASLTCWGVDDFHCPLASGASAPAVVVLAPCSMGTLGRIAGGTSSNLIERAADVALKEGRKLIAVVRETPLNPIHLENMLKFARAGGVVMPAAPAFHFGPETLDDLARYVASKVLQQLGEPIEERFRWEGGR